MLGVRFGMLAYDVDTLYDGTVLRRNDLKYLSGLALVG